MVWYGPRSYNTPSAPSLRRAIVEYADGPLSTTNFPGQVAPSSQLIFTVVLRRSLGCSVLLKSSQCASRAREGASGECRMIAPLLAGSASCGSSRHPVHVSPPSPDHATLRCGLARMLSISRPSLNSTTLFSSAPGPMGAPMRQVAPWSSLKALAAKNAEPTRTAYCWMRRPLCGPWRSWIPAPDDANSDTHSGFLMAFVMRRCVQVTPSSSDHETSACRISGSFSSFPAWDPKNPCRTLAA